MFQLLMLIDMKESTIFRNNIVHKMYKEIMDSLGDLKYEITRSYVYKKIREKTGLSARRIQYILNHTSPQELII